jgi:hypothetical protein
MFVRGDTNAEEYKRNDQTIYKALVVKNNDPLMQYRVKLFIPELSNQPLEGWLHDYKRMHIKFPGKNNEEDILSDAKIFESIANTLPWAEPCFPLFGENSPAVYNANEELAILSDTMYFEGYDVNKEEPPTNEKGAFGPSYFWEAYEHMIGDAFIDPIVNFSKDNNPYCYLSRPSNHVNKPKGLFGIPSVGSQVWAFHYNGDPNFPVYFGTRHNFRENVVITNADTNDKFKSLDYPGVFENQKLIDE